jgi:putative sterol carrier protein
VATLEDCMTALDEFVGKLAAADAARGLDRTVSCRLTDLGQLVHGRLATGAVHDMTAVADGPTAPKADIRLTMSSDDLLALTSGQLSFGPAWASGRVKLEAGLRDMLRLRSLL